MKRKLASATFCLLAMVSVARAQSRPLRVQVSRDGLLGSISLDVKKNVSLYSDAYLGSGFLCAGAISPPVELRPSTCFDSFQSIGVLVRRPLRRDTWAGVGLGGYTRRYRDCISVARDTTGVGGKVFVGYGRGVLFGEVAFHAPGNLKNATTGLTFGVRL
jgi:hypothetical protein